MADRKPDGPGTLKNPILRKAELMSTVRGISLSSGKITKGQFQAEKRSGLDA